MKTVAIRQPWASLVTAGRTRFNLGAAYLRARGRVAVHAPRPFPQANRALCRSPSVRRELRSLGADFAADLPTAAILGTAELVECVPAASFPRHQAQTDLERLLLLRARPEHWLCVFADPRPLARPFLWAGTGGTVGELPDAAFDDPAIAGRPPEPTSLYRLAGRWLRDSLVIPDEHPSARQAGRGGTGRLTGLDDPRTLQAMRGLLGREDDLLREEDGPD